MRRVWIGMWLSLMVGCSSPGGRLLGPDGRPLSAMDVYLYRYAMTDVGVATKGFYPLEYNKDVGCVFAWSNGDSTIEVSSLYPANVDRIALEVASRGRVEALEVQGNDGAWKSIQLNRWTEKQDVLLPPTVWPNQKGQLRLSFRSRTWFPVGDARHLGVSVCGLKVYATTALSRPGGSPVREKMRVEILAGPESHPPQGEHPAGEHEHFETARLITHWLHSRGSQYEVRTHFLTASDPWPDVPKAFESADTIVLLTEGRPSSPFFNRDKVKALRRQVDRGVGLVVVHRALEMSTLDGRVTMMPWLGGFQDLGPKNPHLSCEMRLIDWSRQRGHPIVRGVEPFTIQDQYLGNLQLRSEDARFTPILPIPSLPGNDLWAWAWERAFGGRSFALVAGHSFVNWNIPGLRKILLNAIVWTAGGDVPATGIVTEMPAAEVYAEQSPAETPPSPSPPPDRKAKGQ